MNRTYELMFIVRPDMTDEDLDKLISTLQSVVPASSGTVQRVDKMGKRRLAYMVRRFHEGIYILMVVEGGGAVVHELERRLRVSEPVIKFLPCASTKSRSGWTRSSSCATRRRKSARSLLPRQRPRKRLFRRRKLRRQHRAGRRGQWR